MSLAMKILLSPACNPRRFVRDTVSFLREQPGRFAIACGPPHSKKTEFSLRCAYHLADRQEVLYFSAGMYPEALGRHLCSWYDPDQISRRDLSICPSFGWSVKEIRCVIDVHQCQIAIFDSINLMDIEPIDLEELAQEANISILATRVTI